MNIAVRSSNGGLKIEPHSFKDFSHEAVFGSAEPSPIVVLGRQAELDRLSLPVVFQGSANTCVSCSITWLQQFLEATGTNLSHEWLAEISNTGAAGATVSQVINPAHTSGICDQETFDKTQEFTIRGLNAAQHTFPNYFYVDSKDPQAVYGALKMSPLLVGCVDWNGVRGGHMMVATDVAEDGLGLVCQHWWNSEKQDTAIVKWVDLVLVIASGKLPADVSKKDARMDWIPVLLSKLSYYIKDKRVMGVIGCILIATSTALGAVPAHDALFGAGYTPPTGYTALTTSLVTATDTTIPVSTMLDKAGNRIDLALISSSSTVRVFFNFEPGTTREEPFYCIGQSGNSWTGCVRGLSFQGSSLTGSSTIAVAHPAGSKVIITNIGQFYDEFLSIDGNQTKDGILTFNTFPTTSSTTALPTAGGQLATKYYVDNVGAGGFTASNVGTAYGLFALGTVPEKVGINISATSSGLYFGGISAGQLLIQTSSTGGLVVNGNGSLIVDTADSLSWSASTTFTGQVTFGAGTTFNASSSPGWTNWYGDGSDGAVLHNANATLTRDVYYTSSTVVSGVTLDTNGYRIYALNRFENQGTVRMFPTAPDVNATSVSIFGTLGGGGYGPQGEA